MSLDVTTLALAKSYVDQHGGSSGGTSTADGISYTNEYLVGTTNVKGALDVLVPKSHDHDNKDTLDKLSVSNGKLQYNGSDVGLKGDKGDTGEPTDVQQTTGQSTTAVMSQKATTDEINALKSDITDLQAALIGVSELIGGDA